MGQLVEVERLVVVSLGGIRSPPRDSDRFGTAIVPEPRTNQPEVVIAKMRYHRNEIYVLQSSGRHIIELKPVELEGKNESVSHRGV